MLDPQPFGFDAILEQAPVWMLEDAEGRVIGAIAAGRDGTQRFLAQRVRPGA